MPRILISLIMLAGSAWAAEDLSVKALTLKNLNKLLATLPPSRSADDPAQLNRPRLLNGARLTTTCAIRLTEVKIAVNRHFDPISHWAGSSDIDPMARAVPIPACQP